MSDVDISEIDEMNVEKVSGVERPASGSPFLLMKSAKQGEVVKVPTTPAAQRAEIERQRVAKAKKEQEKREAKKFKKDVAKKAAKKANKRFEKEALDDLENKVTPTAGKSGGFNNTDEVIPSATARAKADDFLATLQSLEKRLAASNDVLEKMELGNQITYHRLKAARERGPVVKSGGFTKSDVKKIDKLLQKSELPDHLRAQLIVIKSEYEASIGRTAQMISDTQASIISRSASLGSSGGAGIPLRASGVAGREDLGGATGANGGDLTGARGRQEPEPSPATHAPRDVAAPGALGGAVSSLPQEAAAKGIDQTRAALRAFHEARGEN